MQADAWGNENGIFATAPREKRDPKSVEEGAIPEVNSRGKCMINTRSCAPRAPAPHGRRPIEVGKAARKKWRIHKERRKTLYLLLPH